MADHRLALVVGANCGIGLGVVRALLARGWDVVATARHPDQAKELRELANSRPGQVTITSLDMNDPAAVDGFAATLDDKAVDAALINAGVAGPAHRSANA